MVEDLDRYYIPLGPFMLSAPLGRGGMGEVWEGIHRTEQVQVAVKVMTLRASRREEFRKAFGAEVQAAARLHHPHIIHVFDYGEVSAETEELSATRLAAGSPYLVMELAVGGSLKDLGMPRDWHEFRTNLLQILDALAHAHARGVIHRDIKPGNVLFGHEEDGRHLLKLSDFGIARAVEGNTRAGNRDSNAAGTPHYMAPEQIHGLWRDQGPWTDLYSVGHSSGVQDTSQCLVETRRWDFNWQRAYWYTEPKTIPTDGVVRLTCKYDNATNEGPIHLGDHSEDEMCLGLLYLTF